VREVWKINQTLPSWLVSLPKLPQGKEKEINQLAGKQAKRAALCHPGSFGSSSACGENIV